MKQARLQFIVVQHFCSSLIMFCWRARVLEKQPAEMSSAVPALQWPQEIFRTARQLWPLSEDKQLADQTTILRSPADISGYISYHIVHIHTLIYVEIC